VVSFRHRPLYHWIGGMVGPIAGLDDIFILLRINSAEWDEPWSALQNLYWERIVYVRFLYSCKYYCFILFYNYKHVRILTYDKDKDNNKRFTRPLTGEYTTKRLLTLMDRFVNKNVVMSPKRGLTPRRIDWGQTSSHTVTLCLTLTCSAKDLNQDDWLTASMV
jgi:hypothetical protein